MMIDLNEINLSLSVLHNLAFAALLAFGADRVVGLISSRERRKTENEDFRSTFLYSASRSIVVAARVYLAMVIAHIALAFFPALTIFTPAVVVSPDDGVDTPNEETTTVSLIDAAPSVAFYTWAGMTACNIKRVIFLQSVAGKKLGRVALFDRLVDFCIFLVTTLLILDQLQIDMTVGLQTVLSAGGVGALAFSLASKDLAEQIVGGIAIGAWDAFYKGDKIRLQDGTEGVVLEIGLLETLVQGFDNIVVRIPNSQLTTARVMNLSHVKRSRLTQTIRFKYSDLDKVTQVLEDIKSEIMKSCPALITDGSKPFRAVLTSYQPDHIQAMVMAHFDIPPACDAYAKNNQEFLLAISRGMKKNEVSFALPQIVYQGDSVMSQ